MIKKHEAPNGIKDYQRQKKKGDSRGYNDSMIRKTKMGFSFEFLFSCVWEEQKTENAVYKDDNISDISRMDTECVSIQCVVYDGKPVQKERNEWKENTNTDYSQASGEMEKIETQARKDCMYFIF